MKKIFAVVAMLFVCTMCFALDVDNVIYKDNYSCVYRDDSVWVADIGVPCSDECITLQFKDVVDLKTQLDILKEIALSDQESDFDKFFQEPYMYMMKTIEEYFRE